MKNKFFSMQTTDFPQMALSLLHAEDQAFVRLDRAGRIIAQTARAEQVLDQAPLRSVFEVLSEETAHVLRRALERGLSVCLTETIDDVAYRLQLQVEGEACLLLLEPEQGGRQRRLDQLAGLRMRTTLALLEMCRGENKQIGVCRLVRLMRQVELLRGTEDRLRDVRMNDLGRVCREAAERTAERLAGRVPEVSIRVQGVAPLLAFEAEEMGTAVYGLLTNAVKGAGATDIVVRYGVEEDTAFFEVEDNGEPLSQAQFSAFCMSCWGAADPCDLTADGSRDGLGLPTVCRIAALHGGVLELEPRGGDRKALRLSFRADREGSGVKLSAVRVIPGYKLEDVELSVL